MAMADQDAASTPETAAATSLLVDGNETITADSRREDGSSVTADEGRTQDEGDASEVPEAPSDSLEMKETADVTGDTTVPGTEIAQDSGTADHAAESVREASQLDAEPTSATTPGQPDSDAPSAPPQADPESTLPPTAPRAAHIQASSTIHRTASPAYSQSSVTSAQGKESVASPSLSAPKKFSTVNINKKFLAKAGGTPPASAGAASNQPGSKESGLGLVNMSARPSSTLAQQQSSSRILTSAKLTSVIPSKTSSVTGGLTAAPAVGWAKTAIPTSAKAASAGINGALSPRTATPVSGELMSAARSSSVQSPGLSALPTTAAPTAIRLTNQGPSAARHLTSLNPVKQPVKRGWQTISPNPESAQEVARQENSTGRGPFGQARFKQSLASDFPTAMEVMEGQRSAVVHAQQAAQDKAAHNQAILEGLNAFRGTNKDPAVHGWDEEDDEDMDFPQVLDFGDGTTYTLPLSNNRENDAKQSSPREMQNLQEQHVSKAERFATDDFDRSWPPKASQVSGNQEGRLLSGQRPSDQPATTRTLYNARSNKMEPSSEKPAPTAIEPSRPQILPRSTRDNVSATKPGEVNLEKSSGQHPLERQPSRERPWGRVPQSSALGADRNPWGRRRPSETEHNRTWGPPHLLSDTQAWPRTTAGPHRPSLSGEAERMRSSPDQQQTRLPPLFSQTQQTSAVVSPPLVHPEPIKQAIDITELQKDEMHRAAEQARLRRQQEEAEREAQKERARQKAKEIAEREAQKLQALAAAQPAQPMPLTAQPHEAKEEVKSVARETSPNDEPPPATKRQPSQIMRRTSEKKVAFEDVVSIPQNRGISLLPRGSSAIPGTASPDAVISSSGDQQAAETARPNLTASKAAVDHVIPGNNPFSAFFDPLAESSHLSPTEIHYNDMSRLSLATVGAGPGQQAKSILPASSVKYNLQPELLQAESWRKSTRGQEVIVPGAIGSSREPRIPQKLLSSKPMLFPVPDSLQTTEDLVMSPPAEVKVRLPLQGEATRPILDDNVGSAFDTVLARLQKAMSSPNEHHRPRVEAEEYRSLHSEIHLPPVADDRRTVPISETRVYFSVLPRPQDFVISTMPLPPSPAPAWKRYTIRLPRVSAVIKPYALRRTRLSVFTPQGWALSWDPPLEQIASKNASREDWLIPKTYHKGKVVAPVKLPTGKLQPYMSPPEEKRPGESSSITSQAIKEEGLKAGSKKVIVKLPTGNFRPRTKVDGSAASPLIREEFQTSSEIPSLSPSSSVEDLPASSAAAMEGRDLISGIRTSRRTSRAPTIAFARSHGESFSDDADAKSSVRFMVSSEIEDDNLLSEVNKMSMDGLTDNPAAEEAQRPGREAETRAPSTPSHSRAAPVTRSGPPSPSLAASSAWTGSATFAGAHSPGRKSQNREHVRNVWTQQEPIGGSSRQSENDSAVSHSSTLDAKEDTGPAELPPARNELDIDLDLPRYPSIHAAPVRESAELGGDVNGQHTNPTSTFEGDRSDASKGYEGYQYMSLSHMGPLSHLSSQFGTRSPIDSMSSVGQQQGVWMPLQQAANGPYSSGISNTGSPIYGIHHMSKSPVSSGYEGTPVMGNASLNMGPMPSMGIASGSMYSHPSGPLDSPAAPYVRPTGYTSQPSHLGGMPGMFSQAGPYANSNREMYGNSHSYGPRGNMGQSILPASNPEYGGRFNNSMTMQRPFGGYNSGTNGAVGGSRYNPGMNGFAQPNAQGTQQQRIGLSGHGKMGPNTGRKVW